MYPVEAKKAKVSGTVILTATIGKDGSVEQLKVVSGPAPAEAVRDGRGAAMEVQAVSAEREILFDIPQELRDFSDRVRVAEIKRHADPLNPFGHTDQFFRLTAEEFLEADHILKAGEHAIVCGTSPDLQERLFLEIPDLLGHHLADGRDIAGMDSDTVGERGCVLDAVQSGGWTPAGSDR